MLWKMGRRFKSKSGQTDFVRLQTRLVPIRSNYPEEQLALTSVKRPHLTNSLHSPHPFFTTCSSRNYLAELKKEFGVQSEQI